MPAILAAHRTPIGRLLGGLSRVPSPTLGSFVIEAVLDQVPAARDHVDECIMGCVLQAGLGQNPARQAALGAGLPASLSCQTINKVCGSGLQSVMLAAQAIKAGDNQLVVAGGFESMSRAPHLSHIRAGVKFGPGDMLDHMQHDGLTCPFEGWAMGCAADYIADQHGISRQDQDRFSAQSHQRAAAAQEAGHFRAEMIVLDGQRVKQKYEVNIDEGVRADSSVEGLAKLRAAFGKEGTVTAGNASQISDGAAALLIASEEMANNIGAAPLAQIAGYNTVGVEPKLIFSAPAKGIAKLLKDHNLTVDDVDLFEINEAFAAQAMANAKELGVPEEKMNICGGGVALGHPIGASGARVLTTLVNQMVRTDAKKGIASLCLGGGNAVSMLIER